MRILRTVAVRYASKDVKLTSKALNFGQKYPEIMNPLRKTQTRNESEPNSSCMLVVVGYLVEWNRRGHAARVLWQSWFFLVVRGAY